MENGTINQKNLRAKLKRATRPDLKLVDVALATHIDVAVLSKFINYNKPLNEESARNVNAFLLEKAKEKPAQTIRR